MGVLTRWTVFPTDHPTLGKVYLGAAGQRCRLTGFEPLDRLSSTNCLSWQPWQGNAWPYSWNPKRHFFSAMFSEQMRYILYFDQYQCRFGGCTHAACYFSAYYSITAVVSACAFAGFEKKCALSVYILYIFGKFFFTSAPRSSAYRCISFCTINFVHLISTRTRYEMPERPELMYLFFVAVKSWNLKQKFLQRWVGVIYPGDRGCFVLTTPNALTDILDSLTSTDILAAGLLEFFTSMDYTYKSYQVCAGTRYFGVYYYVTLRSPLAVRLPKILPERGPLPIIPYQVFRVV